jgi:hypothetical protein
MELFLIQHYDGNELRFSRKTPTTTEREINNMQAFLTSTILVVLTLVSFQSTASDENSKVKRRSTAVSHEGFCILNYDAGVDADGRSQFLCYSKAAVVKYRCNLSGEGGNVLVGILTNKGQIYFQASENNGNSGWFACPKEI